MNASGIDVIRAWKEPEYREGLSEAERAALPANPAGMVELADEELAGATGGVALVGAGGPCNTLVGCGPAWTRFCSQLLLQYVWLCCFSEQRWQSCFMRTPVGWDTQR